MHLDAIVNGKILKALNTELKPMHTKEWNFIIQTFYFIIQFLDIKILKQTSYGTLQHISYYPPDPIYSIKNKDRLNWSIKTKILYVKSGFI